MFYRLKRLFQKLDLRIHIEYQYEHRLSFIPEARKPENVEVELLKTEEVEDLLQVWNLDLTEMRRRLSEGQLCFVPRYNNEIAGYHWLQLSGMHPVHPGGFNMQLKPGESMIYHGRVASKFQSRGIAGYVYYSILSYAKEHNLDNVLVYTASTNIANQKSLAKVGFVLIQKYYALKINDHFYRLMTKNS